MSASFFFYDLETSGSNPRTGRVLQFAGQRTTLELQPIGDPVNVLLRLTPDILPEPEAIMVNGITPQTTLSSGVTEATFLKMFQKDIAGAGTIFVGFNSVSFDDEFMRFLLYRNFYDAYDWEWRDERSRWDMLDVTRMTRALRPEGINWPFASDGSPSNKLEYLSSVNKLDHIDAHDALSDVHATIALARLIQGKQPKLFQYLLEMRDKKRVAELVNAGQPFVYTSGSFSSEFEKTAVAIKVAEPSSSQSAIVFDLRYRPEIISGLSAKEIAKRLTWHPKRDDEPKLPVKVLKFNRCPAVAPMSVLDKKSLERLSINLTEIEHHRRRLGDMPELAAKLQEAFMLLEPKPTQSTLVVNELEVDSQLYDGFVSDADARLMVKVHTAESNELAKIGMNFSDRRLRALLPLYKARNYSEALTAEERTIWEKFCVHRLLDGGEKSVLSKYFERLRLLSGVAGQTRDRLYLLEELRLYGESITPTELG